MAWQRWPHPDANLPPPAQTVGRRRGLWQLPTTAPGTLSARPPGPLVARLPRRRRQVPIRLQPDHPLCRSEEHTSEIQSLMRISYAVFCLKKKNKSINNNQQPITLDALKCYTNILPILQS